MTTAAHIQTVDDQHAVVLSALRVMVERDGESWFAQGIEIDYAASGTSIDDVKERFERGLKRTIEENLRRYQSIARILRWAPAEVVAEFDQCQQRFSFSHVSYHDLSDDMPAFPYRRIAFAERQSATC